MAEKPNRPLSTRLTFESEIAKLNNAARLNFSLRETLKLVHEVFTTDCGFDRAGVFIYDSVTESITGSWGTNILGETEDITSESYTLTLNERSAWEAIIQGNASYVFREFAEGEPRIDLPEEMAGIHHHGEVYLATSTQLVGYVAVDNLLSGSPFSQGDIAALVPIANTATLVILNAIMREERDAMIRHQERVMEISLAISSNEDTETVFLMVRNAILEFGFVDRAAVWKVHDYMAFGTWGTDIYGEITDEHDVSFQIMPGGKYFLPLREHGQAFVIDSFSVRASDGSMIEDVSHAYIPLRIGKELIGIITVDTLLTRRKITPAMLAPIITVDTLLTRQKITPAMLAPIIPIADQAAVAIHKSMLLDQQRSVVKQQKRIIDLAIAITANEDPDEVPKMVRDAILDTGNIDRVGVWLVDGDWMHGTWGTDSDGLPRDEHHMQFPVDSMLEKYAACLTGDEPYVIDLDHEVLMLDRTIKRNVPYAVIPVKAGPNLIGILTLDTVLTMRKLTPDKLDVILPLAKQAAVAIQNHRLLRAANQEITRRQEVELQLQARAEELTIARDEALAGSRIKSEFLANMSHEIRTPMNGVIGMTSMLLQTPLSAEQFDYARVIQESAGALLSVIEDILDISKLEAGVLKIDKRDFNIRDCIEDVAEIMSSQMKRDSVELNCYIPVHFPALLCGDADRVRQIITNLVGNSIKFTDEGEITIRATCIQETETEATIRISVYDTGIGIPEDQQAAIFESFTQVDGTSTRRHGGAGLGLAITKQIVGLLGGIVGLESELGVGSTFWFEIPFAKQEINLATIPTEIEGKSILIAARNQTKRDILCQIATDWNLRAKCTNELTTDEQTYDFLLLDVDLVLESIAKGKDISGLIAKCSSNLILLTKVAHRHQISLQCDADFSAILLKPVRLVQLRDLLISLGTGSSPIKKVAHVGSEEPINLGLTVLLAEDNEVNAIVAAARLEKWGCQCVTVENGVEALRILESLQFDLILMDVSMPFMDGLQTSREIRSREKLTGTRVPIIALTAHALQGDKERCLQAGMDDFVSKPIQFSQLLEKITQWHRHNGD